MNIEELNREIETNFPPYRNKITTGNIKNITKQYLDEFYILISKFEDNFWDKKEKVSILKKLEIQNINILKSIDYFLSGDIIDYYLIIYNTYFNSNIGYKNIYYKTWPSKQRFYRLRTNLPNKKFKNFEMFHIPFEEIRRTGNQRFSLSGHPALYLGSSTFVCWEELSNPTLENCNFSVLGNENKLNLFDLIPPKITKPEDVLRYPLIISSSIKLGNNEYSFKPEYIIPQALYFSMIKFNRDDLIKEKKEIEKLDGIVYLSTHISNDLLFDDLNLMHNFVFPVDRINENGYCDRLKKLFLISESKSVNDLWLKYPQLFVNMEMFSSYKDEYELSIFHTIEKYLNGKKVTKSFI